MCPPTTPPFPPLHAAPRRPHPHQLLPESRPEYPQLQHVAGAVAAINAEVNGKVRGADEAAGLLALHQRLGGKLHDLLAPTRRLHLLADVKLAPEGSTQRRRAVVAVPPRRCRRRLVH